ncbi:MAG: 16S rRNA (guanine(527)-N(7))-methyltransferase RsmG [Ruaniaceae bacterium]|nr:16S rRNA (guanine(527)-N(7))-methyltransferase RsmG [Ruaniaceae bacterium]
MIEHGEDPRHFPRAVHDLVDGPVQWDRLESFASLVREQGELRGLIGPRELPRLWSRHLINSLAISQFIHDGTDVCDVGSGAGFPGLVIAIARPNLDVTLVEPMERRVEWLRDASVAMGLANVEIVRARAEELHSSRHFSVVTARAVASLEKLLRWTWPLVAPGGRMLAMKGDRATQEVEDARKVLRKFALAAEVHGVVSPLDGSVTNVVDVHKRSN